MRESISKFIRKEYSIHKVYTNLKNIYLKGIRGKIIKNYFRENEIKKLQIGCGFNMTENWLNTDIYPTNKHIAYLDAAEVFPFKSESFHYVYSEHVFEHLNFKTANNYLKESFRILKNEGKIRIAMPNIHFLINIIKNPSLDIHKKYITNTINNVLPEIKEQFKNKPPEQLSTFVVNNFFKGWEHEIIYDPKTISLMLNKHGFSEIKQFNIGESDDIHLKNMERHGTAIPPEFNKLETMIFEAIK